MLEDVFAHIDKIEEFILSNAIAMWIIAGVLLAAYLVRRGMRRKRMFE